MDLLQWLNESFQGIWEGIVELLPKCPLYYVESNETVKKYLGMVNWFVPVESMIAIGLMWLGCITIFYVVQVILRWIKVIE